MVRNQNLQRTEFIIADATAAMKLTLWGPPEQLKEDSTYTFKNLTIKMFEEKLLSTNPQTQILKTNMLETVVDLPESTKPIEGHIKSVTICKRNSCQFCDTNVEVNKALVSIKCTNCNKRQLVTSIKQQTICDIDFETENNQNISLKIPEQLLAIYTLEIDDVDDKELFILQHNHVNIEFSNHTVTSITEIV